MLCSKAPCHLKKPFRCYITSDTLNPITNKKTIALMHEDSWEMTNVGVSVRI